MSANISEACYKKGKWKETISGMAVGHSANKWTENGASFRFYSTIGMNPIKLAISQLESDNA